MILGMSLERMLIIVLGILFSLLILISLKRKLPKKVKRSHYTKKWREIQKLCGNKDDWSHAIVHADMLLDEVLKKKRISGKTMGERLVSAQRQFTTNDLVWKAHKLASSIRQNAEKLLDENEVKDALIAFRQALRDLGALR